MAKFTPQFNLYKIIGSLKQVSTILFWIVFTLSIVPNIISLSNIPIDTYINTDTLKGLISIVNIIAILLFFVLDIVIDYVLLPEAEIKRRDDFIDNSFGSKFTTNNSVEYYDNEEVANGLYKAAVNQFENCFFTYSLIKALTVRKIVSPAIVLLTVWVFAYYGFRDVPVALSFLQIFFSANVLGALIKHLILLSRLSIIQEAWIGLFQEQDFKQSFLKYQAHIIRNWLRYETLHSRIQADVPKKVFDAMNPALTNEWNTIKIKYQIN